MTADALEKAEKQDLTEIILVLNNRFLEENGLHLPFKKEGKTPTTLSTLSEESHSLPLEKIMSINYTSISKVCNTDAGTVEAIYKEFVAQVVEHAKASVPMRISFRIGRLDIKNGTASWKMFRDDDQ